MYRLTGRQILVMVFGSALLAAVTVLGVQQISNRLQPSGSAAPATSTAAVADPALATDEENNIEIYKAASPGVVYIQSSTTVRDWTGFFAREAQGTGSGSIIDTQGDILTNYHVIEDAEKLTVSFAVCGREAGTVALGDWMSRALTASDVPKCFALSCAVE